MVTVAQKYLMLASLAALLFGAGVGSAASPTANPQGNLGLDLSKLNQRVTGKSVYDMFPDGVRRESSSPESSSPAKQDGPRSKGKSKKSGSHSTKTSHSSASSSSTPAPVMVEEIPELPPEPVVVEPQPPVLIPTPPFPFKFAGVQRQPSGQAVYFLTKDNRLYTVEVGQILDTVYSIDGEEGGQLTVTYLPLDRKQTISMGSPT